MKNLLQFVFAFVLMMSLHPTLSAQLSASIDPIATEVEESKISPEEQAKVLNARLIEIKDMDKSNMTGIQKKELKNEVRAIEKELKLNNGGVYLSVGAIIIIILLLILIL
ncbi:MAG: hypothetical protein IPH93_05675 [Saprospiraceae bacterium]|nr:hypothetical protein [Saprospiraceae bacterium]MBK7811566.1 hypothetical protein [Saprospiraceae bacterium]MBK9631724.1 hypothetical protein [Saprospiraceae bacterium]